ncbi:MAG: hypothetical protein ACFFAO_07700, partial [Candidatus Hermodarchaeota archaeon]
METEKLVIEQNSDLIKKQEFASNSLFISRKLYLRELFIKHSRAFRAISIAYRLASATVLCLILEIALFFLNCMTNFIFYEIWILQLSIISNYIFLVYNTLKSNNSTILRLLKIINSILMIILSLILYILVSIKFKSLTTLKILLNIALIYYVIKIVLIARNQKRIGTSIKLKNLAIIYLFFSSFNGALSLISLSTRTIEIKPTTEPELIFWTSSSQLPNDTNNLEMCKKYNIGFMPTIRENDVGNAEYMELYKKAIDHEINLYFVIGGNSEFFAHIDNTHEFSGIYLNISQWLKSEGIMSSPFVKSFSIDAEPPKEITELIHNKELVKILDYGYKNYPSRKEINYATKVLKDFTKLVENDGKEFGMIQGSRFLDNCDQDGDISLFLRNIHSLPIKWEYTITMFYRTNRLQYDETDDDLPEFYMKTLPIFYGAIIEGTKFTISELSFFQNVALEENSKDNLAKERYIFVGNFKREFKNTKY